MISFWVMAGGMVFMTIVLTFAGVIQTHLQRVRGEAYMEVQDQIALFYQMRLLAGIIAVVGVVIYLYAILVPRRDELITRHSLHPAE
jgi:nitric oxide reductase subunit B